MTAPQTAQETLALAKTCGPFLDDMLQDVARLNAFVGDRALRRYQADILSGVPLAVRSPFTGQQVAVGAIWMQGGGGIVYRFDGGGSFALTAAELRFGYPITTVTLDGLQVPVEGGAVDGFSQRMLRDGIYEAKPAPGYDAGAQPRAVLGSPNFAHAMWNEYPALRHLSLAQVKPRVSILFDALGALELRCAKLGLETQFYDTPHAASGWQGVPTSFVGSTYCDAGAKAELLEDCALQGLPGPEAGQLKVYLTIRNRGRTVEDQVGFLADLSTRILQDYPHASLVYDGFSMPNDMDRKIYDGVRGSFGSRSDEGRAIVEQIVARLPEAARARVTDLTGMRMKEALPHIGACHYYVAHTGTSQHKIAWFFPRPGCIHSNEPSVRVASLKWLVTQVHDCVVPFSPDKDLVEDIDEIDMLNKVNRNRNYRIKDRAAFIDAILVDMGAVLPEMGPETS